MTKANEDMEVRIMRPFLSDGGYEGESREPRVGSRKHNDATLAEKLKLVRYLVKEDDERGAGLLVDEMDAFIKRAKAEYKGKSAFTHKSLAFIQGLIDAVAKGRAARAKEARKA